MQVWGKFSNLKICNNFINHDKSKSFKIQKKYIPFLKMQKSA